MKISHILYKVNNLEEGVKKFRNKGFTVEYGTKKKPYNAIIYFSEGAYIELIGELKIPKIATVLMNIFGFNKIIQRLDLWGKSEEGLIDLCLENYTNSLEKEKEILKKNNQKYIEKLKKRLDIKNRLLKFKLLIPFELKLPIMMTYFNIDPKPKNYVHPNGVKKIKNISYGTDKKLIPLIYELCEDKTLTLFEGSGLKNLEYEK